MRDIIREAIVSIPELIALGLFCAAVIAGSTLVMP